jgi:glutathione reductase (NADPH)
MRIETNRGKARFVDKNSLEVDGKELKAKYFLIATGAKPRRLNIPGEEFLIHILRVRPHGGENRGRDYDSPPRKQAVASFDADLVEKLMEASKELEIDVILNT